MNYIKRLQEEIKNHEAGSIEQTEMINEFLRYLSSNKFWEDSTIQVSEVYDFLLKIRNNKQWKDAV